MSGDRYVDEMITRLHVEGEEGLQRAARDQAEAVDIMSRTQRDMMYGMIALGPRLTQVGQAAQAQVGHWLDYAGRLEQAHIGFTTMLGDADRAQKFLDDMMKFSTETPFEFFNMQGTVRRMMAYGFTQEEILKKGEKDWEGLMVTIGNAASAAGGGQETIEQIARAIGQMAAKGKITSEEMNRQLSEAGIPAWQILSSEMGLSVGRLQQLSKEGKLFAKTALPALIRGMNKRYPDAMKKQSETLLGRASTLQDTRDIADVRMGQSLAGAHKTINEIRIAFNALMAADGALPGTIRTMWAYMKALEGGTGVTAGRVFDLVGNYTQLMYIKRLYIAQQKGLQVVEDGNQIRMVGHIRGIRERIAARQAATAATQASIPVDQMSAGQQAMLARWERVRAISTQQATAAMRAQIITSLTWAGITVAAAAAVYAAFRDVVMIMETLKEREYAKQGEADAREMEAHYRKRQEQIASGQFQTFGQGKDTSALGVYNQGAVGAERTTRDTSFRGQGGNSLFSMQGVMGYGGKGAQATRTANGDLYIRVAGAGYGSEQVQDYIRLG